jgi:hypothetical protein
VDRPFRPLRAAAGQPAEPLALRYHGHQFRSYNPEIGDGRGFLFAQLREAGTGRLLDLGTKGSGQTPYSRFGDGRLTLKGGVREVLATAMLEALGVPTSRSFSLIETGEQLQRNDEPSPTRSAVLTRLSHSHIRFGTFQRHAFFDRADLIGELVDIRWRPTTPASATRRTSRWRCSRRCSARSAELVGRWMAAGFVHGVLNTDNMNLTGESFDYGPYRFLPRNDPNFTAAYFDETGLYAFGRQPEAVFWNLRQLAGALTLVTDADPLVEAINGFSAAYRAALAASMLRRLGLAARGADEDIDLVNAAFKRPGRGRRGAALGAVLLRLVRRPGLGGPRPGRTPRGALRRRGVRTTFRARLAPYEMDRPDRRLAAPYFADRSRARGAALRRDRGDLGRHRRARRLGAVRRQARRDRGSPPLRRGRHSQGWWVASFGLVGAYFQLVAGRNKRRGVFFPATSIAA